MSNSKVRVCLVAPYPPPYGGIAHWTAMMYRYACDRQDAELVLVNTAPRWRAIHTNNRLVRSVGGGIQLVRDILRLIGVLSLRRADVIHLTTSGQLAAVRDLAVSLVAAAFGVPLVYHIRFGRIPEIARADVIEWRLIRMVMSRAAAVIVIDRDSFSSVVEHVGDGKVEFVPNCVNFNELPSSLGAVGNIRTALFIGWVIPAKGVEELVDVWSQLAPQGWRLEIVGPVEDAYRLKLQDGLGAAEIDFAGALSHREAMNRLSKCDLFVLPSHTEGFPNSVLEAMALGKAIVATRVGAIPEMLGKGAGLLIDRKNKEQLREAIVRVVDDPVLRQQLGAHALLRAQQSYSIEAVFGKYRSIWLRALSGV